MTSYIQETLLNTDDEKFFIHMEKLGVTQKMLQEKMDRIKNWYKSQPHLPLDQLRDQYLMRHLAVDKFNEEKTKKKIERLFSSRTLMPEYFNDRDPFSKRMTKALKSLDLAIMPTLTENNHRVIIFKLNIDNREDYDLDVSAICGLLLADIRLETDSLSGEILICDVANLSFQQIKQLQFPALRKLTFLFQHCYGAVIHGMHLINAPPVAELAINVIKTAMKKKLTERLMIHTSMESFYKAVPTKYLPKDMGGDVPFTTKEISTQWGNAINTPEMREWVLDYDSKKTDESKRLGEKDYIMDDMIGIRGTFRKLDLD